MKARWGNVLGVGIIMCALVAACVGDDPAASGGAGTDGGTPEGGGCTSTCATEGATQCSGTQIQTCSKGADGCLKWDDPIACGTTSICCGSACIAVDGNNCYACGAACSGATPRCLAAPKKCGCSVATCASTNQGCSPQTGACETCTALPAGASDIFVDGTSFAAATGTESCPVKTVTAAITKALASSAPAVTIHVAAGTYDAAHGETFPFVLRGKTITVVGDGADKTTIQGAGLFDHSSVGGTFPENNFQATFAVGDEVATITLSKLTVRAPQDTPVDGYVGVFCDMGNTPTTITNPPVGFPAANTVLDGVTIGPGYQFGVLDSNSGPSKKGCNLSMTNSTVTDSKVGIWAVGAGRGLAGSLCGMSVTKCTFKNITQTDNNGVAVTAWDGASRVIASDNVVSNSNLGLTFVNHARADVNISVPPYYEIERNTISDLTNAGIALNISMVVEKLNDNSITNIHTKNTESYNGVGLILDSGNAASGYIPLVKQARRNTIVGNDIGIVWRGGNPLATQADNTKSDFGTGADPGKNVIACNSTPAGSSRVGYDLFVQSNGTGAEPSFKGNAFDHAPVSPVSASTGANGTDVLLAGGSPASFDFAGATVKAAACPAGTTP